MDHLKEPDHRLHLPPLQPADEVPLDAFGHPDRADLGQRFLQPILPHNPDPGRNRSADQGFGLGLGGRDKLDVGGPPPNVKCRLLDVFENRPYVTGDTRRMVDVRHMNNPLMNTRSVPTETAPSYTIYLAPSSFFPGPVLGGKNDKARNRLLQEGHRKG
jgi:hypothetical protein